MWNFVKIEIKNKKFGNSLLPKKKFILILVDGKKNENTSIFCQIFISHSENYFLCSPESSGFARAGASCPQADECVSNIL